MSNKTQDYGTGRRKTATARVYLRPGTPLTKNNLLFILGEYGSESWQREKHRVRLATLKLAGGNIDELRRLIDAAQKEYRDVITAAEYPMVSKRRGGTRSPDNEMIKEIIRKDWMLYASWLWKE